MSAGTGEGTLLQEFWDQGGGSMLRTEVLVLRSTMGGVWALRSLGTGWEGSSTLVKNESMEVCLAIVFLSITICLYPSINLLRPPLNSKHLVASGSCSKMASASAVAYERISCKFWVVRAGRTGDCICFRLPLLRLFNELLIS